MVWPRTNISKMTGGEVAGDETTLVFEYALLKDRSALQLVFAPVSQLPLEVILGKEDLRALLAAEEAAKRAAQPPEKPAQPPEKVAQPPAPQMASMHLHKLPLGTGTTEVTLDRETYLALCALRTFDANKKPIDLTTYQSQSRDKLNVDLATIERALAMAQELRLRHLGSNRDHVHVIGTELARLFPDSSAAKLHKEIAEIQEAQSRLRPPEVRTVETVREELRARQVLVSPAGKKLVDRELDTKLWYVDPNIYPGGQGSRSRKEWITYPAVYRTEQYTVKIPETHFTEEELRFQRTQQELANRLKAHRDEATKVNGATIDQLPLLQCEGSKYSPENFVRQQNPLLEWTGKYVSRSEMPASQPPAKPLQGILRTMAAKVSRAVMYVTRDLPRAIWERVVDPTRNVEPMEPYSVPSHYRALHSNLAGKVHNGGQLKNVDAGRANLAGSKYYNRFEFDNVSFLGANLDRVEIGPDCTFQEIDLRNASCIEMRFAGQLLTDFILSASVDEIKAKLKGVIFNYATKFYDASTESGKGAQKKVLRKLYDCSIVVDLHGTEKDGRVICNLSEVRSLPLLNPNRPSS